MNRTPILLVLAVALAAATAGCGSHASGATSDLAPEIDSMTPNEIKANFTGAVTLQGAGFTGAHFTANGQPISSVPGASVHVVDDYTATIDFNYGGAGQEVPPGFYVIHVKSGLGEASAPGALHVKTFLQKVDWVRTLALPFTRTSGAASFFVRPRDFSGQLLYPGSALVGTAGVVASDYAWTTTSITPVGSTTPLSNPTAVIADASFQFLGEGSNKPLAIALCIDQSGSMHQDPASDPNDERITQAEAFVQSLHAGDEATIYSFQDTSVTQLIGFTTDKTALYNALETLRTGVGGGTPLYNAMLTAVNAAATENGAHVGAAIVLTDGKDNGSTNTPDQVISAAQSANVPVFSIGLGNPNTPGSIDTAELTVIADQTGGKVFLAADPSGLQNVFESLEGTLDSSYEVTTEFTFGTALPAAGSYEIEGVLTTTVDGESVDVPVPPFTVSVVN